MKYLCLFIMIFSFVFSEDLIHSKKIQVVAYSDGWKNLDVLWDRNENNIATNNAKNAYVTFAFMGDEATIRHILVSSNGADIRVLGSRISSHMGFFLMETFSYPTSKISLPSKSVRYLRFEFSRKIEIRKIKIEGIVGHKEKEYPFHFNPTSARRIISKLKQAIPLKISKIEKPLLQDVLDGKLDHFSLTEAALIASRVYDRDDRVRYVKQIDTMYANVKNYMLNPNIHVTKKARYLLLYLHKNHLKDYDITSTSLLELLDDNKFNCVSSSILYNIIANKSGLNVKGVEAPAHSFSILYDGSSSWDIETTSPLGFDIARSRHLAKIKKHTNNGYVTTQKLRREMPVTRQIAMIYYNQGVDFNKKKQYIASSVAYFKALFIDNNFDTAGKNLIINFSHYAEELIEKKNHGKAYKMLALALDLAPNDNNLKNNLNIMLRNWGADFLQNKKYQQAIKAFEKGKKHFPQDSDFSFLIAYVSLQEAMQHKESFAKALFIYQKAIQKIVDPEIKKEFMKAKWQLVDEHAKYQIKKKNWKHAVRIYGWAQTQVGGEILKNAWIKTYIDWAQIVAKSNSKKAIAIYNQAIKKDPQEHFKLGIIIIYEQQYKQALKEKKYAHAFQLIVTAYKRFPKEKSVRNNLVYVYQEWHNHLLETKKYKKAHQNFRKIIKLFPREKELVNIYLATSSLYAAKEVEKKQYAHALAVYSGLYQNFPNHKDVKNNFLYTLQNAAKFLVAQKKYAKVTQLLRILHKKLPKTKEIVDILINIFIQETKKNAQVNSIYKMAQNTAKWPSTKALDVTNSLLSEVLRLYFVNKNDVKLFEQYNLMKKEFNLSSDVSKYMKNLCYNRGIDLIKKHLWAKSIFFHKNAQNYFPEELEFTKRVRYSESQK